MYEEQIEELEVTMKELRGWPVIEDSWDGSDFDWMELTLEAKKRGLKYEPFMSFHVLPDQENNSSSKLLTVS